MNKPANKSVPKTLGHYGIVASIALAAGIAIGIYQMRDSKFQKLYSAKQEENQKLKEELEKKPRPTQYLSGKLKAGSKLCWNKDIELVGFDVKPGGETSLTFRSGGKTTNQKCAFGQDIKPVPGILGRLTFKVIKPKLRSSWINWDDQFEFEATYKPFIDTENGK